MRSDTHALTLRVPPDIHAAIAERALQERRSWTQQCIVMLEEVLQRAPASDSAQQNMLDSEAA